MISIYLLNPYIPPNYLKHFPTSVQPYITNISSSRKPKIKCKNERDVRFWFIIDRPQGRQPNTLARTEEKMIVF